MSQDLGKRIVKHNNGENKSTKGFRPWNLVLQRSFETRLEARDYERFLKSGVGREFLKDLLK
ncbi:GIY-YIG nuclease family protein [Gramella sp. AN32]|uniref:GIY-YIG nuclease family protein n=1 Tax=Christiangramia antarctica TaxID=2058158 RepID=A0ABW5X367_9FLAO|nr:GIY-YIG nuclease family protein [Gramella sp. AN32]